jgi:hypothetical protein
MPLSALERRVPRRVSRGVRLVGFLFTGTPCAHSMV